MKNSIPFFLILVLFVCIQGKAQTVTAFQDSFSQKLTSELVSDGVDMKYNFFKADPNGTEGECYASVTRSINYIAQKYPDFDVTMAITPFNNPNVISVTHPSAILKNKTTGETYVVTADTYKGTDGQLYNNIHVNSLGKSPNNQSIAGALMQINRSPVVRIGNSVYANGVIDKIYNEKPKAGNTLSVDGASIDYTAGNKAKTEIFASADGNIYVVNTVDMRKKIIAGVYGEVKSVGFLTGADAVVGAGTECLANYALGSVGRDVTALGVNLLAGDAVNVVKVEGSAVHDELKYGVKIHPVLDPESLSGSLGTPIGYVDYTNKSDTVHAYADSTGAAALDLTYRRTAADYGFHVTHDAGGFSESVTADKQFGKLNVYGQAGYGSSVGNVDVGSNTVNNGTTNTTAGNSWYVTGGASYHFNDVTTPKPIANIESGIRNVFHRKPAGTASPNVDTSPPTPTAPSNPAAPAPRAQTSAEKGYSSSLDSQVDPDDGSH